MKLRELTDAELLAMHADAQMPPNVLDPVAVRDLVDQLTEEEAGELEAYAGLAQSRDDFVIRASSWLIRKFNLQTTKGAAHAC